MADLSSRELSSLELRDACEEYPTMMKMTMVMMMMVMMMMMMIMMMMMMMVVMMIMMLKRAVAYAVLLEHFLADFSPVAS